MYVKYDWKDYLISCDIVEELDLYLKLFEKCIPLADFFNINNKRKYIEELSNNKISIGHILSICDHNNISKFLDLLSLQYKAIGKISNLYWIISFLDSGSRNNVYEGLNCKTGQLVALKILKSEYYDSNNTLDIGTSISEYQILSELSYHKNIITAIDCLYHIDITLYQEQQQDYVYKTHVLILECALFNMQHFITCKGPLIDQELYILYIFKQLIAALLHMHQKHHIVHRDLKLEQILINSSIDIVLSDFNLSCSANKKYIQSIAGSKALLSPESLYCSEYYNSQTNLSNEQIKRLAALLATNLKATDIWNAGLVLLYLVTGILPLCISSSSSSSSSLSSSLINLNQDDELSAAKKYYNLIVHNKQKSYLDIALAISNIKYNNKYNSNQISMELKDLLMKMLDPNPLTRITINEIITHSWYKQTITTQIINNFEMEVNERYNLYINNQINIKKSATLWSSSILKVLNQAHNRLNVPSNKENKEYDYKTLILSISTALLLSLGTIKVITHRVIKE